MGLYREGARFCSSACRQRAYRVRRKRPALGVPEVMASRDRWVRWSLEQRRGYVNDESCIVRGLNERLELVANLSAHFGFLSLGVIPV